MMTLAENIYNRQLSRYQLFAALMTAALDFFHLGLVYPIFSEIIANNSIQLADSALSRAILYSSLIAAFPLGQFIGSPYLGKLSDRYGRRRILLITIAGSGIGMAICGLGVMNSNAWLILLGRIFGGIMGANLSLAYALIVDSSQSNEKVKNMALIPLSTSLGFGIGPLITGLTGNVQIFLPFAIAICLSLLNWILAYGLIQDRMRLVQKLQKERKRSLLSERRTWKPLILTFLMITANFLLVQFVGPYSTIQLGADIETVSWIYVNLSVSVGVGHIFLTRRIASIANPETVLPWSLGATAIALLAVGQTTTLLSLHVTISIAMLCCAVAYTNVFANLSNSVDNDQQGEVMGLGVSVQCLAEWLPPLCLGIFVVSYPAMPMIAGAIAGLLGLMILLKR